ncbi:bifunctional folylpolyglutamate synthase/dihydrofolate synthase [Cryptosporangium sp. NPDC048952]|uniref:bifunctional folylpolyglutamate synthase/dihydrofolate synthase n=1 Tax=Cryptosporangium sp. NPDC048952 TaxID=3363961 RepID=UPI00371EBE4D
MLADLGDPQDTLRVVHVAGTAGKGSVCTFLTAVLEAHGHLVGRYLSPHTHTVLERFALRGRIVDAARLSRYLADVRRIERERRGGPDGPASMFEVLTATAYELFAREGVDYAVIETGLGGLHDATNVVGRADKLAVLTSIGLDHIEVLGESLEAIAAQKAGILPLGGVAVAVSSGREADTVVRAEAVRRRCRLDQYEPAELEGASGALRLGLPGRHQQVNAGLALKAAAELARRDGWKFDPEVAARGLAAAQLPGRFERRRYAGHPVILDGVHNPMKLTALIDAVEQEFPGSASIWVIGVKPDKDLDEILRLVRPAASLVIATEFGDEAGAKAVSAEYVAATAARLGLPAVEAWRDPSAALTRAVSLAGDDVPVVVTGSFHTVAAVGRRLAVQPIADRAG